MLNKITIHGRLAADPELRKAGDKSVASFTIACDRDFGEKKADFINCVAWEKKAEHISSYFGKGQEAIVNGRLQTRNYADKESVPLEESAGYVCSEFVMCYPPGIPILAPGERITKEILEYIAYAKAKGCSLTGPEDPTIEHINIIREGEKFAWNSGSVNATLRMSNTACG